ncbi:SUMO-conjugating enzyme SCE1 isoform X1 [Syzygium oleosum]|uniref:SUMO-conjugating enzyme SCE1 isoform X1 n=1 Tax=Syzygium oleosum TaxID=219896 RepID=UPI0024BA85A1|nr:SUMO-conjugating enzyme SCE1 isoform X1 [Syzygium oleosum]
MNRITLTIFSKKHQRNSNRFAFADHHHHTKSSAAKFANSPGHPHSLVGSCFLSSDTRTKKHHLCYLGFVHRSTEREREGERQRQRTCPPASLGVACRRSGKPGGFVARPETAPDGSVNLMVWHCTIPGKAGTDWEGGNYPLTLYFTEDYPSKAPKCMFPKDFFHLNVYGSGMVCLSILNEDGWRPSITVRQILVGIQDLLDQPNPASAAKYDDYQLFVKDPAEYQRKARQQAKQYPRLV